MAKKEKTKKLVDHDVWIKQFDNGFTFEGHKTYEPYERETKKVLCGTEQDLIRALANYLGLLISPNYKTCFTDCSWVLVIRDKKDEKVV